MRILALDYGKAHTGAAISDPTGTLVRPLDEISGAATEKGIAGIAALVQRENAGSVVVGVPVPLAGGKSKQTEEAEAFIAALNGALDISVIAWDERFTSKIAFARGRYSRASSHSLAACVLLEDYLEAVQKEP